MLLLPTFGPLLHPSEGTELDHVLVSGTTARKLVNVIDSCGVKKLRN